MRETWQSSLTRMPASALDGRIVKTVSGSFDDFSEADAVSAGGKGKVDGVIIAQAYHWSPDHEAALVSVGLHPLDKASPAEPLSPTDTALLPVAVRDRLVPFPWLTLDLHLEYRVQRPRLVCQRSKTLRTTRQGFTTVLPWTMAGMLQHEGVQEVFRAAGGESDYLDIANDGRSGKALLCHYPQLPFISHSADIRRSSTRR